MDLHALMNEGWTNTEFAQELGYHPATIRRGRAAHTRGNDRSR